MSENKYQRDKDYAKKPQWSKLYNLHCPENTDGCSRHCVIIADDILRDTKSPIRRWLIDEGYEPDHWAESIEITVEALWEARAEIARLTPTTDEERV